MIARLMSSLPPTPSPQIKVPNYEYSGALSAFVRSEEGRQAQQKVWTELLDKLDYIVPGVSGGFR